MRLMGSGDTKMDQGGATLIDEDGAEKVEGDSDPCCCDPPTPAPCEGEGTDCGECPTNLILDFGAFDISRSGATFTHPPMSALTIPYTGVLSPDGCRWAKELGGSELPDLCLGPVYSDVNEQYYDCMVSVRDIVIQFTCDASPVAIVWYTARLDLFTDGDGTCSGTRVFENPFALLSLTYHADDAMSVCAIDTHSLHDAQSTFPWALSNVPADVYVTQ